MIKKIEHLGIAVASIDASLPVFEKLLLFINERMDFLELTCNLKAHMIALYVVYLHVDAVQVLLMTQLLIIERLFQCFNMEIGDLLNLELFLLLLLNDTLYGYL